MTIDNLSDALAEVERLKGVCFEQAKQCDRHRHEADTGVESATREAHDADMEPEALRYFAAEVAMHASITGDPVARENAELMRALANAKDALATKQKRAWDEGWIAGCDDQQYGDEDAQPSTPNPYRMVSTPKGATTESVVITRFDLDGEDVVRTLATDAKGDDLDLLTAFGMIELAKDSLFHREKFGEVAGA